MPPSEQNSGPVNQPVSNVPEYLHLDPIPEPQAPKSKKKLIAIISAVIVLIVAIAAGAAVLLYMSGETDRRLYGAIENLMSSRYVTQKTVVMFESKTTRMMETKYDLSAPGQPKSHSNFNIDTEILSVAGEMVVVDRNEYFIRFTRLPEDDSQSKIDIDTWYKVQKTNLKNAPDLIRSFNFDRVIPPVYGEIILGNFGGDVVDPLMTFIRNNGMYAYTSAADETEQTVYTLSLDSKHVGELNKQLAKQLGVVVPSQYDAMAKNKSYKMEYALTINKQSGKVQQITQMPDNDEKNKTVTTTVTYTYPTNVSVKTPSGFKEIGNE